ncbi:FecR family protein [Roseivirga sp. E12]|uniref:FecR family protein n=1 Tax=Roseivirga sp. E12 TaxID=2819237 RepID=UPI001ABC42BF|nr:FecR domain-containing protein [Roseivirga sp. E12]MBO3698225.1 FecR domain-containing protein [Roseivirga sp. E12]
MENNKRDKDLTSAEEQALFSKLEFSYAKSKDDVWADLDDLIENNSSETEPVKEGRVIRMNWVSMSIAASMVLLLSYGLFARFYTKTVTVGAGEFISHVLPDGSQVHLNAASTIKYAPYWWKFDRKVKLDGEAFFEVEKGERFAVYSSLGVTEVLGTKFNIYARGLDYEVFCETGKVGVSNKFSDQVVLLPGESVKLNIEKLEKEDSNAEKEAILAWRNNEFNYNTTRLSKVFADFERQYNITIELEDPSIANEEHTGVMKRPEKAVDALELILPNYNLSSTKRGKTYLIKRK